MSFADKVNLSFGQFSLVLSINTNIYPFFPIFMPKSEFPRKTPTLYGTCAALTVGPWIQAVHSCLLSRQCCHTYEAASLQDKKMQRTHLITAGRCLVTLLQSWNKYLAAAIHVSMQQKFYNLCNCSECVCHFCVLVTYFMQIFWLQFLNSSIKNSLNYWQHKQFV